MEIYLRFLLLFVCVVFHQSYGNVVVSEASLSGLEHDNLKLYIMLKEQIEAMNTKIAEHNIKTAEEMTKFTEKFYNKIEELDGKICALQKLDPDNSPIVDRQTTSKPSRPGSVNHAGGTTFVRWGRQECPSNISVPVYIGTVGGSEHTHTGGAAEHVCLPPDPQWDTNKHFNGPYWGYMYGAEYEQIPDSNLLDLEVPCSVYLSTSYSTTIMIPGRSQCYPGWQEAYHGELTSDYYNHPSASEYICLDHQSIGVGSKTNHNGKLLYPIRAQCGSLPCPPYEHDRLLTCVVCLGGTHDL